MADFTIAAPVPFVVEGAGGKTYELPRFADLTAEQVDGMADVSEADGMVAQVKAMRDFVLSLCPDLADEPLTDMGYMRLFQALAEGSGIEVGES